MRAMWREIAGELLVPGSAFAAGIWLFYRLFVRSDKRERDAFREVKEQRDYWRSRAEDAEETARVFETKLIRYKLKHGPLGEDEETN